MAAHRAAGGASPGQVSAAGVRSAALGVAGPCALVVERALSSRPSTTDTASRAWDKPPFQAVEHAVARPASVGSAAVLVSGAAAAAASRVRLCPI
jgi:hypothetical protein